MNDYQAIDDFVHNLLEEHGHSERVDSSDSLILSGLLDSLAVIHIVVFLEEEFGIDFSDLYFDQTNFDSIDKIAHFVKVNKIE